MKKTLSIVLCIAMLLALTVPAFASGEASGGASGMPPMMMGASYDPVEITEDTVLGPGEYEGAFEGNGCTVTLADGAKVTGTFKNVTLIMQDGSKWTVGGASELDSWKIGPKAVVAGSMGKAATMTVDGLVTLLKAGESYSGDIRVFSGDEAYPFYLTVIAGKTSADEAANVSFSGEITDKGISDFVFESDTCGLADITGRTDEAFILGGDSANFSAAELDIHPDAQAKLNFASFDSRLMTATAPAISMTGSAFTELRNVYADASYHIMEIGGNETDGDTVTVYRNSYLNRQTFTGDDIADASWCHTTSLFARGNVRTSMSVGNSQTYYYGTAAVVDGWSAMATDAGGFTGVDVLIYNSLARNLLGGYGTYADTGCRVFLYGTDFLSGEFGGIIANNGELYVSDTDTAAVDTNTLRSEVSAPFQSFNYDTLQPLAYAEKADLVAENTGSNCLGFRNGVMMHVPDLMHAGGRISDKQGVLYVKNATLGTSLDCAPEDWATGGYEASWKLKTDDATWAWIEHTLGSAVCIRSDNAWLKFTDADIVSWSGVLVQTILNNDANGNFIGPDEEIGDQVGVWVNVDGTTALKGDIRHEDYQRTMYVTLSENASLTGDIFTGTVDDWHAAFADYADSGVNYYRDIDGYDKIWGTYVTLEDNAVWTVTDASNVTGLTVASGAVINGTVTVDGKIVDTSAGGSWEGDIVVTPAAASGEASGR